MTPLYFRFYLLGSVCLALGEHLNLISSTLGVFPNRGRRKEEASGLRLLAALRAYAFHAEGRAHLRKTRVRTLAQHGIVGHTL